MVFNNTSLVIPFGRDERCNESLALWDKQAITRRCFQRSLVESYCEESVSMRFNVDMFPKAFECSFRTCRS